MNDKFECEKCKPFTFDLKQYLRELFCIHHFVFYRNSYLKHTCHKCGMRYVHKN